MRIAILFFVAMIAGCNQSDNDSAYATTAQLPPNESTSIAVLRAEVSALQASVAKLQLIGQVHGTAFRTAGISGGNFLPNAVNFGPCADMGVLEGTTFASGNGPLGAVYQAFKNCTNTHAEYAVDTGQLKTTNRLYFITPDCSGTPYIWQAGGQGYNAQTLNDGVAFISPVDGQDLWVTPNQTPAMVQAVSAWITTNGDCEPDGDLQLMWAVSQNDSSKTGVPVNVGKYQLAPP